MPLWMARRATIIALNGFSILALEFAAARQLAPVFGQAMVVWSALIGVFLVALAVGYAWGGRWGAARGPETHMGWVHALVALWIVVVAVWGPACAQAVLPSGLPDGGMPLGLVGTLLVALLLYAPPAACLAMTTPFLLARSATAAGVGRLSGFWLALGTVGSLVACWLVPLECLQRLGTRVTLLCIAGVVGVQALLTLVGERAKHVGTTPARTAQPLEATGRGDKQAPLSAALRLAALALGFAITAVEFGGVRLFAPWVGQSNYVWAAVIGCCMLALALGSWVGGRVASAGATTRAWSVCMALAALLLVVSAVAAPQLLDQWVPTALTSVTVLPAAFPASLAASLLLLGPSLMLMGAALPLLIHSAEAHAPAPGRRTGKLLAYHTAGALSGCLFTGPVLVTSLGSRGTLALAALVVACVGARGLGRDASALQGARRWVGWGTALLSALGVVLLSTTMRGLRHHEGQLLEVESAYQTIRVVEEVLPCIDPSTGTPADGREDVEIKTRFLRHDEDAETYQSVLLRERGDDLLTGGRYFETMALGPHLVPLGERTTLDVLIVGHAGGTVWRTLRAHPPHGVTVRALSIEIDPAVVDVAREALDHVAIEDEHLRLITGEDARTVVNVLPEEERFDLVLIDAYTRTNYVPFQVATVEFFEKLRQHVRPEGWIAINVLGDGAKSRVAQAVGATATQAVGPTYLVPNPYFPGNVILWTGRDRGHGPRLGSPAALHPGLQGAAFALERLCTRLRVDAAAQVLTDDLAPSDRLADQELGVIR